jgi:hypothetical protein
MALFEWFFPVQVPASIPVFIEVLSGNKAPTESLGLVLALLDVADSTPGKEALLDENKVPPLPSHSLTVLQGGDRVEDPVKSGFVTHLLLRFVNKGAFSRSTDE